MNENKPNMNETFKPFQQVLVRGNETEEWVCGVYSHYDSALKSHCAMGVFYNECIPYEGNKALLGTTDSPQPKRWRAERGGHYWYVDYDGTATEIYESFDYFDDKRYSIGNYFRTFEDAEDMAVKFRALLVKAMLKGGE